MLNLFYPVASLLGIEVDELIGRLRRTGLLWAAIVLFAGIALVFVLVAINTATTAWLGPLWGPLALAGSAAIIALLIYVVARITAEIAHRREAERRRAAQTTAVVTTAAATALPVLLKSPLMRNLGLPLGGALAAMFLLSKSGAGHDDTANG
jgi:membrane protein implicated in regulation of membrane protease activity